MIETDLNFNVNALVFEFAQGTSSPRGVSQVWLQRRALTETYGISPAEQGPHTRPITNQVTCARPRSEGSARSVVALARREDVTHSAFQQADEAENALRHLAPERGQLVVHAGRVGGLGFAMHEPVAL